MNTNRRKAAFVLMMIFFVYKGVRILGLGGSMEYIPDSPNQYTEKMMRKRIHKLWWKLWRHKGFDILVTHARHIS